MKNNLAKENKDYIITRQIFLRSKTMKPMIFVIEDNDVYRGILQEFLEAADYRVKAFTTAEESWSSILQSTPDLILLDLTLPGMDGTEFSSLLKQKKETAHIPIIIITGRNDEVDIVTGLKFYADDYVVKPFSNNILLARIEALLRRSAQTNDKVFEERLEAGPLKIEPSCREVFIGSETVELTKSEFDVLYLLIQKPGKVFSRDYIISVIRDAEANITPRAVDVIFVGLRKKLNRYSNLIQTVRGIGYKLKLDGK